MSAGPQFEENIARRTQGCHPERVRRRQTSRRTCGCFSAAQALRAIRLLATLFICSLLLTGCKPVGPDYNRPGYNAPSVYKEAGASAVTPPPNPTGGAWQPANPSDGMLKGKWWEIYQDPQLNQLEERIATNNVQLKQALETYLAARDQVSAARANLYPTLSASVTPEGVKNSLN